MQNEIVDIQNILTGDIDVYGKYIDEYKDQIYVITYRLTNSEEASRDITFSTFQHIYDLLPNYNENGQLSDWFFDQAIPFIFNHIHEHESHQSTQHDFYQHALPIQKTLLLHYVLDWDTGKIGEILNISTREAEHYLYEGQKALRMKITDNNRKEDCLSVGILNDYFESRLVEEEIRMVDDHLEFCPACREILSIQQKGKEQFIQFFQSPYLDETFKQEVLATLIPYSKKGKKIKTWKYQLLTTSLLLIIVFIVLFVVPKIIPYYTMAVNYIKFGEIYNVWTDGKYTATDRDVTIEVTGMDISPNSIALHYKVESDISFPVQSRDSLINVWDSRIVQLQFGDEIIYPENITPMFLKPEKETTNEGTIYFSLKTLESIPDEFTILLSVSRVAHLFGDWNIEIPVNYAKANFNINIFEIDERIPLGDDLNVRIETFEMTPLMSQLTVFIEMGEEEREKKRQIFETLGYIFYEDDIPDLEFEIVTSKGEVLSRYYDSFQPEMTKEGIRLSYHFMNMLIEEDLPPIVREWQQDEPLFLELKGTSVLEKVDVHIPITLREGTYDVDYKVGKTHITSLDIFEEESNYNSEENTWKIVMKGKKEDGIRYDFYWSALNDEGVTYDFFGVASVVNQTSVEVDLTILQQLELWTVEHDSLPESFILSATLGRKYITPLEPIKIPIYQPNNNEDTIN